MKKILILFLIYSLIISPVMAHSIVSYGSLTAHSDGLFEVTLAGINVWKSADRMNDSRRENMGFDNGGLVIQVNGTYMISDHGSFQAVGGGGEYGINMLIDGAVPSDMGCHQHITVSAGGVTEPVSLSCIQDLNESQNITLGIKDNDSPLRSILGFSAGLSIIYIDDQAITLLPPDINFTTINFDDHRLRPGKFLAYYSNGSLLGKFDPDSILRVDQRLNISIHFEPTPLHSLVESQGFNLLAYGYLPYIILGIFLIFIIIIMVVITAWYIRKLWRKKNEK